MSRNVPARMLLRPVPAQQSNRCALVMALWVAGAATLCAGQAGDVPQPAASKGAPLQQENVYVDDSFEAADAISEAAKLVKKKRWVEAARLLQQTSERWGSKLIETRSGCYTSISEHINGIISGWPAEGLKTYRSLYEPAAKGVLRRPGLADVHTLLEAFRNYFNTSSAAALADRIGQRAIESGEFDLARSVYRHVLDKHPDREQWSRRYGALLGMVDAMQGDRRAEKRASHEPARGTVRWMGRELPLAEAIQQVERDFAAAHRPPAADDWPTFGGAPSRDRVGRTNVDELGLSWRLSLKGDGEEESRWEDVARFVENGDGVTMNPVVFDGAVVVQYLREVIALRLTTGTVLWRYRAGPSASLEQDAWEIEVSPWQSPTVAAGRVFAAMPASQSVGLGYDATVEATSITGLDLETGHALWSRDASEIAGDLENLSFDASPVVAGDWLYVVGRRRRSFGFEDCYLFGLRAGDGQTMFQTHLGSASTGMFAHRHATLSIPTVLGSQVFVSTNLGAIACLDRFTGMVRWLTTYPRSRVDQARRSERALRNVTPWHQNPVLPLGDRVAALPTDSLALLLFDRADGSLTHSEALANLGDGRVMLAAGADGELVLAGEREVVRYQPREQTIRWRQRLADGADLEGRPMIAGGKVLVPTDGGINLLSLTDGTMSTLPWDAEGEGGNVVALPDQVLVASSTTLSAYVRLSEIWKRLEANLAADTQSPEPALELAEVALRLSAFDRALNGLRLAAERFDKLEEPPSAMIRQRLYEQSLRFARTFQSRNQLTAELLNTLHVLASRTAPTPEAEVNYRLTLAPYFEQLMQPATTVRLYQQILLDRSLREMVVTLEGGRSESAGGLAQAQIALLMDTYGDEVYSAYRDQSRRLYEQAAVRGDEPGLLRVAESYPNSEAGRLALIRLADIHEQQGRHADAARALIRAYRQTADADKQPALLGRIATAYREAGRLREAYRWYAKAAADFPVARLRDGGEAVSFAQLRDRLGDVRRLVEPSRPRVGLPLARKSLEALDRTGSLLVPRYDTLPDLDWSQAYVYEDDHIVAYDAGMEDVLWMSSLPSRVRPEWLLSRDGVAVFGTMYELFGLNTQTGERVWSYSDNAHVFDDPNADWEDTGILRRFAVHEDYLVSVRDEGKLLCVNIKDGSLIWNSSDHPTPAGPVVLADDWLVYHVLDDDRRMTLCAVDANTGAWIGSLATDERLPVLRLYLSLDGAVIVVTSQSIASYDLRRKLRRWRVTTTDLIRESSLLMHLDALYYSTNNRHISRLNLRDGQLAWRSQQVAPYGSGDITLALASETLLVTSEASVCALDLKLGTTLWEGTTSGQPRFLHRAVSADYLMVLDIPRRAEDEPGHAYFYDHRNASGVRPVAGGRLMLGPLRERELRGVLLLDGALLVQVRTDVLVWTSAGTGDQKTGRASASTPSTGP